MRKKNNYLYLHCSILKLRIKQFILKTFDKDCSFKRKNLWDVIYPKQCTKQDLKKELKLLRRTLYEMELLIDNNNPRHPKKIDGLCVYFMEKFITDTKCIIKLHKNNLYTDAFMVSGYMLECLVSFLYLLKTKRTKDFLDYKKFQGVKNLYCMLVGQEIQTEQEEKECFRGIKKYGRKFIKPGKNEQDIINKLQSKNTALDDKYKAIAHSYYDYWFKDTINATMKKLCIPQVVRFYYSLYASVKHHNENDIYFCKSCNKFTFMPVSRVYQRLSIRVTNLILKIVCVEYRKLFLPAKHRAKMKIFAEK